MEKEVCLYVDPTPLTKSKYFFFKMGCFVTSNLDRKQVGVVEKSLEELGFKVIDQTGM